MINLCGGSYHDDKVSSKKQAAKPTVSKKDDRIKKAVPTLSKSAVRTDGSLEMQPQRKHQFA